MQTQMSAPKPTPPGGCLTPIPPNAWWSSQASYLLRLTNTIIGSAPEADVRILDQRISRTHAVIAADNDSYDLIQRSTKNPTFVNQIPVASIVKLKSGDIIELAGGVELRLDVFPDSNGTTKTNVHFSRRLSAILAADVVGYCSLMETDSETTLRKFEECLAIFRREVERHGGRLVQKEGDSILALFNDPMHAVSCARALQQALGAFNRDLLPDRQMPVRIGVNTGGIMVKPNGKVEGHAVNLAFRIQSLAEPGGVLVSRAVYDQIELGFLEFESKGTHQLKNISREVEVYQLVLDV